MFMTIVTLYAWLSGMNTKTNIWIEINLGIFFVLYPATLFHFCNYAHYFVNIVRYQKILFEYIYICIYMWCFLFILRSRM